MSTIMLMHWPELSKEQYEQARKEVNWERDAPQGAKFHVAWFDKDGFHVLDLWESRQDFERFMDQRVRPVLQKIGVQGQSKVQYAKAHAVFAPNI
ncbi:MAG: hypothetical protein M3120_01335 [Pseudomonadota bacterium]|nr:hypothetical protein [Pseudomonadota bacterium]